MESKVDFVCKFVLSEQELNWYILVSKQDFCSLSKQDIHSCGLVQKQDLSSSICLGFDKPLFLRHTHFKARLLFENLALDQEFSSHILASKHDFTLHIFFRYDYSSCILEKFGKKCFKDKIFENKAEKIEYTYGRSHAS